MGSLLVHLGKGFHYDSAWYKIAQEIHYKMARVNSLGSMKT